MQGSTVVKLKLRNDLPYPDYWPTRGPLEVLSALKDNVPSGKNQRYDFAVKKIPESLTKGAGVVGSIIVNSTDSVLYMAHKESEQNTFHEWCRQHAHIFNEISRESLRGTVVGILSPEKVFHIMYVIWNDLILLDFTSISDLVSIKGAMPSILKIEPISKWASISMDRDTQIKAALYTVYTGCERACLAIPVTHIEKRQAPDDVGGTATGTTRVSAQLSQMAFQSLIIAADGAVV